MYVFLWVAVYCVAACLLIAVERRKRVGEAFKTMVWIYAFMSLFAGIVFELMSVSRDSAVWWMFLGGFAVMLLSLVRALFSLCKDDKEIAQATLQRIGEIGFVVAAVYAVYVVCVSGLSAASIGGLAVVVLGVCLPCTVFLVVSTEEEGSDCV